MRPVITTWYTARAYPWYNVMDIITTWLWDDTVNYQEEVNLFWWDAWILWTWFTERAEITTNYT